MSRQLSVPCTVEIAHSASALHAHVTLEGVEIEPGDMVRVEDAPEVAGFGTHLSTRGTATVRRAGRVRRMWTRWSAIFDVVSLCEVGFSERR